MPVSYRCDLRSLLEVRACAITSIRDIPTTKCLVSDERYEAVGQEQVLASKMWKTMVIQNRHDCSLSNDVPIVRVKSLDLNKNPFLNSDYFIKRKKEHEMKRKLAYQKSTAARSEYYVS